MAAVWSRKRHPKRRGSTLSSDGSLESISGHQISTERPVNSQTHSPIQELLRDSRALISELSRNIDALETDLGILSKIADDEIILHFDGGKRSSGAAYGSFRVGNLPIERRTFGSGYTSNQAEYKTLLDALEWLRRYAEPAVHRLVVYGDSQVVIRQLSGEITCRNTALQPLYAGAKDYLREYHHVQLRWVPRKDIVEIFGH